jgi:Ino eighty subunit 2
MPPRQLRARKDLTTTSTAPAVSTRPRRATATQHAGTTIERSSPDEGRHSSIRLTVKSDPKKLKDATGGSSARDTIAVNTRDAFVPGEIVSGPRQTRKKAIVESDSEDDDDEDVDLELSDAEEDEDDDGEGEDDDGEGEEDEDEDLDAEGEEDTEMMDAPLPPLPYSKPGVPTISVEEKEMLLDDDDDDELSSLLDDDAEGELEEELGEDDAEGDEDDELDSEGEIVSTNGRGGTPDMNKMTRRQRAVLEEQEVGGLMALSNGESLGLLSDVLNLTFQ